MKLKSRYQIDFLKPFKKSPNRSKLAFHVSSHHIQTNFPGTGSTPTTTLELTKLEKYRKNQMPHHSKWHARLRPLCRGPSGQKADPRTPLGKNTQPDLHRPQAPETIGELIALPEACRLVPLATSETGDSYKRQMRGRKGFQAEGSLVLGWATVYRSTQRTVRIHRD